MKNVHKEIKTNKNEKKIGPTGGKGNQYKWWKEEKLNLSRKHVNYSNENLFASDDNRKIKLDNEM